MCQTDRNATPAAAQGRRSTTSATTAVEPSARTAVSAPGWTFAPRRDWGSPAIPGRYDVKTLLRLAPLANVLDILRSGIEETLVGLGRTSIRDVVADDVLMPPSFTRTSGAVVT